MAEYSYRLKQDYGNGFEVDLIQDDVRDIGVLNGSIKLHQVRTGSISKEQLEEALKKFIEYVSID